MCRRRERGVTLVAASMALAVMTVLALGLAHTSAVEQRLAGNALAALQADALLRSGVAAAAVVLRETGAQGQPDTLQAPWARESGRQPLGAGWIEVRIEDAARRLDLNSPALAVALPRLLDLLQLDAGLADAVADWIDADDTPRPRGAEREWYLAQTPRRVPRNGPFASVEELGLVRAFDAADLVRLAPHVVVAGEHVVNPNTASREVLAAVLQDPAAVERLLAARVRRPLEAEELTALLPETSAGTRALLAARGQRYVVRVTAGVGELRRSVEALIVAPPGVDAEVMGWRAITMPSPAT